MLLGQFSQKLGARSTAMNSQRFLRARWERGYLKDLYHRRQLLGGDPVMARSSFPNWNYSSEIFALGHRIGAPDVSEDVLVQALTSVSYSKRPDVDSGAAPSGSSNCTLSNSELAEVGRNRLSSFVMAFIRYNMQKAPEEFIQAVATALISDEVLSNIGRSIGLEQVIRTAEHPPADSNIADSFRALMASLSPERATDLTYDLVLPQLLDVDFADVLPLNDPFAVLSDLLFADGATEVQPRIIRSMGEVSAQPVYVVGIYIDKETIVGQSAGESVEIATEMAAREALLRLWGVTSERMFLYGERPSPAVITNFSKCGYFLSKKCCEGTDLSLRTNMEEPVNVVEIAMRYQSEIDDVVGKSYTKRLRHKFSRGSLAKRSFKYLVKPKVYTVA